MGVNAEGKISLSVELQNFKDIASDLKKGLSAQLKQVPLDIEFNNKDLEKKAAEAVKNINEIISKSRVKNLDLSSILPNFVNEINKEGISDEIRMQMIKGFESALTNLRDIGINQDYSKLKGFNGEDLKAYIADLNDVMDILKTIEGLTERQKQGILTTVLPSLSSLNGRGKDAAKKEYTKGAKRLDAILQLSGNYNDVWIKGIHGYEKVGYDDNVYWREIQGLPDRINRIKRKAYSRDFKRELLSKGFEKAKAQSYSILKFS